MKIVLLIVSALLFNSCSPAMIQALRPVNSYDEGTQSYNKAVRVLYSVPTSSYEVLTVVTGQDPDMDEALELLQKNAAEYGADAVIIRRDNQQGPDEEIILMGEAIRFTYR
jgi:uncharacterized protein YbjQ (UPF0145 family)